MLSLNNIASALNGRVSGNKVVAPGPEAANHPVKRKRNRYTVTVYIIGNDIGVNCHHASHDPIAVKDWVRQRAGFPACEPKIFKPKMRRFRLRSIAWKGVEQRQ